jgi:hypothetical protein
MQSKEKIMSDSEKLLTAEEQVACQKIAASGEGLAGQRAAALLAIDQGAKAPEPIPRYRTDRGKGRKSKRAQRGKESQGQKAKEGQKGQGQDEGKEKRQGTKKGQKVQVEKGQRRQKEIEKEITVANIGCASVYGLRMLLFFLNSQLLSLGHPFKVPEAHR